MRAYNTTKPINHHHDNHDLPDWAVGILGLILCLVLFVIATVIGGFIPIPG